jgi:hypothetical protein
MLDSFTLYESYLLIVSRAIRFYGECMCDRGGGTAHRSLEGASLGGGELRLCES